jgi:hypothetical protein
MLRVVIVAGGGVLVLCLLLTAAVDALLRRSSPRHAGKTPEEGGTRGEKSPAAVSDNGADNTAHAERPSATPKPSTRVLAEQVRPAEPSQQSVPRGKVDGLDRESVRTSTS